jgi:signal transduction histidine kinase
MSTAECANCGSTIPGSSRFCPECGRPLSAEAAASATAAYESVRRRRVWPPDPVVLVVVLVAAGGIILLVGGQWAWGLAALLLAGIVVLAQREVERRTARATFAAVRERVTARRDVWSARSRGQLEVFRARRDLAELEAQRGRGFHDLGRAVFEADETGMEAAKTALAELTERLEAKEAEIQMLVQQIEERVRRVQAGVQATDKMEQPPEPVRVPEPWPPPDEGTPPAPAPVPEPSPADPAPEPEHPPTPQSKRRRKSA